MEFCTECGTALVAGQATCASCGHAVAGTTSPSPTVSSPSGVTATQAGGDATVLVTIGDITVNKDTVYTPSGSRPVGAVTWQVIDNSTTRQAIPTWAIVCAIIFALLCLIGLLFLLVKEERTEGSVLVTVQGDGLMHTAQIPVQNPVAIQDVQSRVAYARSLSAAAAGR